MCTANSTNFVIVVNNEQSVNVLIIKYDNGSYQCSSVRVPAGCERGAAQIHASAHARLSVPRLKSMAVSSSLRTNMGPCDYAPVPLPPLFLLPLLFKTYHSPHATDDSLVCWNPAVSPALLFPWWTGMSSITNIVNKLKSLLFCFRAWYNNYYWHCYFWIKA